jgi:S1-C subfamily serine protease
MIVAFVASMLISVPVNLQYRALPVLAESGRPMASAVPLSDSILVTNHHVVDDHPVVVVACGEREIAARVILVSKLDDLALLGLETPCELAEPSMPAANELEIGHQIYIVGFPIGQFAVKSGIVTRYFMIRNSIDNAIRSGMVDAQVLPGNSVVFGRLCVQLKDGASCEGAFVPVSTLLKFLAKIE